MREILKSEYYKVNSEHWMGKRVKLKHNMIIKAYSQLRMYKAKAGEKFEVVGKALGRDGGGFVLRQTCPHCGHSINFRQIQYTDVFLLEE